MRILIARFDYETNTLSPVSISLASFHPHYGADVYRAAKGTHTATGAFIDLAKAAGVEIVVPVVAGANPSGHVATGAYITLCDAIVAATPGYDALLLGLHGAIVTENSDDGEGDLLERLYAVVPDALIAITLDSYGNLTQKLIDLADIAVSLKMYPHADMYETGEYAGRLLFGKLADRANPVFAWRRLPMVTHTLRSHTDEGTMHRVVMLTRRAETDGISAVSTLTGFGLAGIATPYFSAVVVGNGDKHTADAMAQRIVGTIWGDHEGLVYHSESLTRLIAHAAKSADAPGSGPVPLLDHGDNCMSGGTCDDMRVLYGALWQGLSGVTIGPVRDLEAVVAMIETGEGATVMLPVGDKVPLMQFGIYPVPRVLTDKAVAISGDEYTITGPIYTGQRIRMGRAALLDTGATRIVVAETPQEHWDLGIFTHIDVDPYAARLVLLKSRMYCRLVLVPIAKVVVEYDDGDVTNSDCTRSPFVKVQRPVFPSDVDAVPA